MREIWKDIPNYDGLYQISNFGRVKSFNSSKKHFNQNYHFLKPNVSNNGYEQVTLYNKNRERHKYLVHKLVAEAFLSNPHNYPCVNHKDENKLNNSVDNLEWCSYAYNNAYGTARIRTSITKGSPISQYTLDGFLIANYVSSGIINKLFGFDADSIIRCCNGKMKTAYGYIWKWFNETNNT